MHDELVFGGRERLGTGNKRQRPAKRQVHNLASWLEAWNIFLAVHVQSHPREALQLVKYQAINTVHVCHLFTAYSAAAYLKYDSLFRQPAARDKSKLIAWDHLKEDILVWCTTRQPFWPSKFQPAGQADSRVTGPPSTPSGRITHPSTGQVHQGVPVLLCTQMLECGLWGRPISQSLHSRGPTPWVWITRSARRFAIELADHPDKAWVSWLLDVITNGVQIGYNGPQFSYVTCNLVSALQHPVAVEEKLRLEMEAGRVHGPFLGLPLPNFRTSGLGVVPKKNGKWRVILHLSAPAGVSINDSISKEEYTLHHRIIATTLSKQCCPCVATLVSRWQWTNSRVLHPH